MWTRTVLIAVVLAASPAARADDPERLDEVVERVVEMKARGASNQEIGDFVNGVVDRRITNGNSPEGDMARYKGYYSGDDTTFNRWSEYEENRESIAQIPGKEYEGRARWSWDLKYGHCAENSALVYYILHKADLPVQIYEIPGHSFAVLGDDGQSDPRGFKYFPDGAYVVDPWYGMVHKATEVGVWEPGDNVTLVLTPWGHGWSKGRTNVTDAYNNPTKFEQYKQRGGVVGTVVYESTGEPAQGVPVVVTGQGISNTLTTDAKGRFLLRFKLGGGLPAGAYTVTATPPADQGEPASAAAVVQGEGALTKVDLVIKAAAEPPHEPGVTAPDPWTGKYRGSLRASLTHKGRTESTSQSVTITLERRDKNVLVTSNRSKDKVLVFIAADNRSAAGKGKVPRSRLAENYDITMTIDGTRLDFKSRFWHVDEDGTFDGTLNGTLERVD